MASHPIDLNILPAQYRAQRIPLLLVAGVMLAAGLLLGLIPAYLALATAQSETVDLEARLTQTRLALTQAETEQVQLKEQLAEIELQIEQGRDQTLLLRQELDTLRQRRTVRLAAGISAAITNPFSNIRISSLTQKENIFTLTGQAGSEALLLDYARTFQASGQFSNVRILSITNSDRPEQTLEIKFTISLEQ